MNVDQGVAINASTYLYTVSIQFITSICENNSQLVEKLFHFIKMSMEGQHEDLRHLHGTEEECVEVLRKKSGSLTALSSVLGVYLATGKINATVESYSIYYGVAEQISNDFLRYFQNQTEIFKKNKRWHSVIYKDVLTMPVKSFFPSFLSGWMSQSKSRFN